MRFMSLYKPAKFAPPTPDKMAEMGRFVDELKQAGVLIATDGVAPGAKTAKYRLSGGKFTATDGPFAEAKELIGGYAVLNVKSMEHLAEVSQRFLKIAGEGECEVVQMFDECAPA